MRMNLRSLEYFVVLAESRSFNEAAKKLYLAQPSLTRAVQSLERELGFPLFHRTSSGVTLTHAGEQILPEARQILAYMNDWKALARQADLRQVHIYSHASLPDFLLPPIILKVKKKYPELSIQYAISPFPEEHISRSHSRPVLSLLICDAKKSLARFTGVQGNAPAVLFEGEYRCLVNPRHPLAGRSAISPEDLRPFFLVVPHSAINVPIAACWESQFARDIAQHIASRRVINVESVPNVLSLVQQDPETYALSYDPALYRYQAVARKELVPIRFERPTKMDLCLFYDRQACRQHAVIQEIVREVQAAARRFLSELDRTG